MSITPVAPAENSKGKVRTWVNSRWKFRPKPGQFSMKLNRTLFTGNYSTLIDTFVA
jgi:hypothetical protein